MISTVLSDVITFFKSLTLKDVIAAVWAPFSIFVGAWTAFYFNNRRATRERIDDEVTRGNLAISVLAQFYNQQVQYRINYIDPHKNAPDAWFKIMAGPPLDSIQIELNRNDLGFLLQTNGAVWQQAVLEERRFHLVKALIDERNDMLAKAWAKLEASGVKHGSAILLSDVEKILGPVLYQQLQHMGSALIDQVTQNVRSSMEAIVALRAELVRSFPKRKFIDIVPVAADRKLASAVQPRTFNLKPRKGPVGKYLPHEKND